MSADARDAGYLWDMLDAARWFGLMANGGGRRAVRALPMLIEAVR